MKECKNHSKLALLSSHIQGTFTVTVTYNQNSATGTFDTQLFAHLTLTGFPYHNVSNISTSMALIESAFKKNFLHTKSLKHVCLA